MKRYLSIGLIAVFLIPLLWMTTASAQSAGLDESELMDEYNLLMRQVNEEFQDGLYDQAVQSAEEAMAWAKAQFGDDHPITREAIFVAAQLNEAVGHISQAELYHGFTNGSINFSSHL